MKMSGEKQLLVNLKYFPTYCKEEFVHHFNKLKEIRQKEYKN